MMFIITDNDHNQQLSKIILTDIKVPLFIFLLFYQAMLTKDLNKITAQEVYDNLIQISTEKENDLHPTYEMYNYYNYHLGEMLRFLPQIQPIITAIWYIVLQSYIFHCLNQELLQLTNNNDLVISYFFILFVGPIYLIFGALIQNHNLYGNYVKNFLWLPVISNILSVISTQLWNLVSKNQQFRYISRQIGLYQPTIIILYLAIKIFRFDQSVKRSFAFIQFAYLIVFPFLILLPISELQSNEASKIASWALFSVGIFLFGVYFIFFFFLALDISQFCSRHVWKSFKIEFKHMDNKMKFILLWMISFFQIISFHMLMYVIVFQETQKFVGVVIGLQIINFVLFLCNFKYLEDKILDLDESQAFDLQLRIKISKLQRNRLKKLIKVGQILPFILFLTLHFLILDETYKISMLILAFGIPMAAQYFQFLQDSKEMRDQQDSSDFVFFVVFESLKFLSIAQTFIVNLTNDSNDFSQWAQILIRYNIFLIIFLLAKIAIFYITKYQIKQRDNKKKKGLSNTLSFQWRIHPSKQMLKKIYFSLKNNISISTLFERDSEIALLIFYDSSKKQEQYFLFQSLIQHEFLQKNQIQQENKSQLIKNKDNIFHLIFCERKTISFENQTRKELQTINLKKEIEDEVILSIYEQEKKRQQKKILKKNSNDTQISQQTYCHIECKSCLNKSDQYAYLLKKFEFSQKIKYRVYVNLKKYENWEGFGRIVTDILQLYYHPKVRLYDDKCYFSHILKVIFRFYDYYTLAAMALDHLIQRENQPSFFSRFIDFSFIFDDFFFKFNLALVLTFLYLIFGMIAVWLLIQQLYNREDDGGPAKFCSRRFLLHYIVLALNTQCIFVWQTFLNIFFCELSNQPHTVYVEPSILCMSETHFKYIILAMIGLLTFFPLSAFLNPILQHVDRSTNFKFDPVYLLYYQLAKLLTVGIQIVSKNKTDSQNIIYFNYVVLILLIGACYKKNPCKILLYNPIESLILLQILFVCISFQQFFIGAQAAISNQNTTDGWSVIGYLEIMVLPFSCHYICCQPFRERESTVPANF